jgi:hypothetical protein
MTMSGDNKQNGGFRIQPERVLVPWGDESRMEKYGAPETIRTSGLTLRRGSLYPTELRGPSIIISTPPLQFITLLQFSGPESKKIVII